MSQTCCEKCINMRGFESFPQNQSSIWNWFAVKKETRVCWKFYGSFSTTQGRIQFPAKIDFCFVPINSSSIMNWKTTCAAHACKRNGTPHPKWNFQSCCFRNDWICCGACWTIDDNGRYVPTGKIKRYLESAHEKNCSPHMKTKPYIWSLPDLDLQTSPKVSPWQPWNKHCLFACIEIVHFFAFVTFIAFDWSSRNPMRSRKPIENPIIFFRQRRFVLVFVFYSSTCHNIEMLAA